MSESSGQGDALSESCPNDDSHGAVGCAEVIRQVWLLLDGECGPDTREQLRRHPRRVPAASSTTGSRSGSRR